MQKLKIFGLLAMVWLIAACEKPSTPYGCRLLENDVYPYRGVIGFAIADKEGRNYFEVNQGYYYGNFMAYDENWEYARTPANQPWNMLKYDIEANEHYIKYSDYIEEEPYFGKDRQKTFYLKFSKDVVDIDTLLLEYKALNKCMNIEYLRIYFNNELVQEYPASLTAYKLCVLRKK